MGFNTYVPLTGQANLQDKVDTLQNKVIKLQDKLDTFQNTTEASTRKNHHEVVELLQNNTNSSLDGKVASYSTVFPEEMPRQVSWVTDRNTDQNEHTTWDICWDNTLDRDICRGNIPAWGKQLGYYPARSQLSSDFALHGICLGWDIK